MRQEGISKRWILAAALALLAGLAAGPASAQGGLNKDADEILRSMSTFLGGTKAFSVAADIGNEVISREGEKLQLSSYATVVFQRPAGFYVHRQGRSADVEAFFDGKTVSLSGKNRGVYVQKEVVGTTDDAFNMITSQIGVDLPGGDLLASDPYAVLSSGVTSSGYHGRIRAGRRVPPPLLPRGRGRLAVVGEDGPPAAELGGDALGAATPAGLELRFEPWYPLPAIDHRIHGQTLITPF